MSRMQRSPPGKVRVLFGSGLFKRNQAGHRRVASRLGLARPAVTRSTAVSRRFSRSEQDGAVRRGAGKDPGLYRGVLTRTARD